MGEARKIHDNWVEKAGPRSTGVLLKMQKKLQYELSQVWGSRPTILAT